MTVRTTRSAARPTGNPPILVVGGGLTGLSAALLLSWHGVPVRLVERHAGVATHPRARGLHPRAMEIMRQTGLEHTIRQAPSALALVHNDSVISATTLRGEKLSELDAGYFMGGRRSLGALSPTGWCQCHQAEVEPILRRHARRLGARLDLGTEMTAFHQDADQVTATLRTIANGAEETVRVPYLIAADGVHSGIRRRLGIDFDGTGPFGRYVNIHFRADLTGPLNGRRFIMAYINNPRVRAGLMPLDNSEHWLLHVILDPVTDDPHTFTAERCRELVRAAAGVPELPVEILGTAPWEAAARTASRLRAGRIFLAGDAAHVMPPTGSFGANTGILETHNLAWKLAAVHFGQATDSLLDSYDAERRPAAAATVRQAVLRSTDRRRLTSEPDSAPDPRIVSDTLVWFGSDYAPDTGPWAERPDGRPGTRAPHIPWQRPGAGGTTGGGTGTSGGGSVLDLFGRRFVLLTGPHASPARAVPRTPLHVRSATVPQTTRSGAHRDAPPAGRPDARPDAHANAPAGSPVRNSVWHTAAAGMPVPMDSHSLPDIAACATYGITPTGAVLVRPDGYVAWRSVTEPAAPAAELRAALAAALNPTPRHTCHTRHT